MEIIYSQDQEETPPFNALLSQDTVKNEHTFPNSPRPNLMNTRTFVRRQPNNLVLKKLIRKQKVERLVSNFCSKISRNITHSPPVEFNLASKQGISIIEQFLQQTPGIELSSNQLTITTLISISLILLLSVSYSLALVFPEVKGYQFINNVQYFGLVYFAFQIALNFLQKSYDQGKYIQSLKDIAKNYLKGRFLIDCLSYIVLLLDSTSSADNSWLTYCRLIILAKLSQNLERVEVIQNLLITNYSREQYWGLVWVLLANFSFAHILALVLNSMSLLDENNWISSRGLTMAPWYERYVWGYYWATTTMLTVGFGDFAATNYKEAICLIFVEMISCISLAYNINCVGNLISNLRSQSLEKNKNQKIFSIMAKSNRISYDLETRINHYIEGSFLIKKEFNFNEQDSLLEYLPSKLKKEYLRESNKSIFANLSIFKDFTDLTRSRMAENMVRIITHPEEIIQKKGQITKFIVLQKGQIECCVKKSGSIIDGKSVHKISVMPGNEPPRLLSLDFLKGKHLLFNLKSLSYCVLFYFQNDELLNLIKQNNYDFEHYCMVRDREAYMINELELEKCQHCPRQYHSVFLCPKLHYCPLKQQVLNKEIFNSKYMNYQRRAKKERKKTEPSLKWVNMKKQMESFSREWSDNLDSGTQLERNETGLDFKSVKSDIKSMRVEEMASSSIPFDPNIIASILQGYINKDDDFWMLQSDQMCNWKYYFPAFNPDNISQRTRKRRRW